MSTAIDFRAFAAPASEPVAVCPKCHRAYSEAAFQAMRSWRVVPDFANDPTAPLIEQIDCPCVPRSEGQATLSIEHITECSDCNDGGWAWGQADNGDPIHALCRCRGGANH